MDRWSLTSSILRRDLINWEPTMVCSKCGSEDTQRLEDSFDAGTPKEVPPAKRSLRWPGVSLFIDIMY